MTIKPRQMLVPTSKYKLKCPNIMNPQWITVHNTYNDASANSEINYMRNNNSPTSYHFAIDDKEVVQGLPLNRNGWHCGDGSKADSGNRTSIGIEICYSKSGGERYYKAEKLAIRFIAQLLHERGWGIDRVRSHKEWSQIGVKKKYSTYVKNCPHRIYDEGRWESFKKEIEKELNKLKGKGGNLTVSQYNELKKEIEELRKMIQGNGNVPDAWARKDWEEMKKLGITDGSRPKAMISRQEVVVLLKRLLGKLNK